MPKVSKELKPFWTTKDGRTVVLYHGDVLETLRKMPTGSVHCVVTSPPYWGLRAYLKDGHADKALEIGSEKTPQEFVEKMVAVFREVRRVLRDDGTCYLNLGDSYGSTGNNNGTGASTLRGDLGGGVNEPGRQGRLKPSVSCSTGLKSGNLVGIPWRVALALQADGWILRQDIVWSKPSPMPESVRNRCTKAHEYIFLLVKRMGYFYDAEAIKEKDVPTVRYTKEGGRMCYQNVIASFGKKPTGNAIPGSVMVTGDSRNKRSVWTVAGQGYEGSHFACFPPKLIEPCILAGTSEKGCCAKCGAPWKRVVEKVNGEQIKGDSGYKRDRSFRASRNGVDSTLDGGIGNTRTVGWEPGCACDAGVVPCTVLDPFVGSATTCCVSIAHGRRSIGIDLSKKYLRDNAVVRIEGELIKRPADAHLTGKQGKRLSIGKAV